LAGFGLVALAAAACSSPSEDGPGAAPGGIPGGGFGQGNGGAGQVATGNGGSQAQTNGGTGNLATANGGTGTALGMGGSAAAGAAGAGAMPGGAGLDIKPNLDGFVSGATNGIGVQGAFYTAKDPGTAAVPGSAITPASFATVVPTTGEICVQGTAAKVALAAVQPDPLVPAYDYTNYWGAVVGLNLSQPNDPVSGMPSMTPVAWNTQTTAGKVTGFSFTLTGPMIPAGANLRFKTTFPDATGAASTQQFCVGFDKLMAVGGTYTVPLSTQTLECWNPAGAPFTNPTLLSLQWQVVTNVMNPVPFNFCVSNVKALIGP